MIESRRLLADLVRHRADLEADLRERCEDDPGLDAFLQEEHRQAVEGERTALPYAVWRDDRLTQVAVAWILACVFVRFLEDNGLVDPPRLSGPGERRGRALDEHTLYFRAHPTGSDRDYLLHVFRAVAALPVARQLFDAEHNPIWSLEPPGRAFRAPSGDAAGRLLDLWRRIDPDSGVLAHDFTDPARDTRSWATCTRTSPSAPASSTRCSRRPSSSKSSSSTARSRPPSRSSAFAKCA